MTELWATPIYGKKDPEPRALVKETEKMIVAAKGPNDIESRFTKLDHPSAIAYRPSTSGRNTQYLFTTRKACLLYMAQDALGQAEKLRMKSIELRYYAKELFAQAGEEEK